MYMGKHESRVLTSLGYLPADLHSGVKLICPNSEFIIVDESATDITSLMMTISVRTIIAWLEPLGTNIVKWLQGFLEPG